MSMRTRLAIVLATVMIGPLLAAWAAIGVVVPRANRAVADDGADRGAAAAAFGLADRCRSVGESARTTAQRLATELVARGTATGPLTAAVARAAADDLARRLVR